eukprot:CAMPEP_0183574598 /NCGR_PEP_ID=MMETSP0371-20130417/133700_1 /TAXON_ID=268820 /ORGANISM="Peridinium aciculiferum, Strain PAER-2" /LENGTH=46 /DNA_ID= /DNA_START= /DNA_END= /DNA_ORIENTATION=
MVNTPSGSASHFTLALPSASTEQSTPQNQVPSYCTSTRSPTFGKLA